MTEREIFTAALERNTAERAAFLGEACAGDAELRRRVEKLLVEHEQLGSFLEISSREQANAEGTIDLSGSERPGHTIGPYKLLQQIGEGGFGLVFMAEQTAPVRRKVAVKVIKPGMDTRQVIARFEAERQALAVMDHPNIARVFDAGSSESGRPYFVMELVRGVPITAYCDEANLPIRERLALFTATCQAIQHAHTKGIIHRDIKPSNVLVTRQDGEAIVKVIDFGVAKAMGQHLTDKTLFTDFRQMIGTPLYMSPEQAELSGADIDTRSDIYSLGVLLYELLTGTTPVSKERMKQAAFDEVRRIIREDEPERPSTRIGTTESAPSIAAQRHTEPAKLARLMRGELDWIVMKSLDKDRNRRYETASGFAADVERYLNDEAVLACPPSGAYRVRKFARRNRGALAVAGLVLSLIVLFGCGVGWILYDRSNSRRATSEHANRALSVSQELFRKEKLPDALAAAREAEAVLRHGGASEELRRRVQKRIVDLAMVGRLDEARMKGSAIKNDSRFALEDTAVAYSAAFREFGIDVETMSPAGAADLIRREEIREHLTVSLDHWASLPIVNSQLKQRLTTIANAADDDEWRKRLRAVVGEGGRELTNLAASPDVLSQPSSTLILLAAALRDRSERDAAIDLLHRAQRRHPGDFWINLKLGNFLWIDSPPRYDEAIRFLTAAVSLRPDSPGAMLQLGIVFDRKGLSAEAIASYEQALGLDPDYIDALVNYGLHLLSVTNDYEGAIVKFTRVIELDPKYHWGWSGRARANSKLGRHEAAVSDLSRLLAYHPDMWNIWAARGNSYLALGQPQRAIADFTKAINLKADFQLAWAGRSQAFLALDQPERAAIDSKRLECLMQASALKYEEKKRRDLLNAEAVKSQNP